MNFCQGLEHGQRPFRLPLQAVRHPKYLPGRRQIGKLVQYFPGLLFGKHRVLSQKSGSMGNRGVDIGPGSFLVCSHKNVFKNCYAGRETITR